MKSDSKGSSRVHDDALGCKKLIVTMIVQALSDIKHRKCSQSRLTDWHHAYNWIFSESFVTWCEMIDFDYKIVRKAIAKIRDPESHD